MTRLFSIAIILLFISGCVKPSQTQHEVESSINNNLIKGGDISLLETYKDNSYITSSKPALPATFYDFTNAMELAIYSHNLEAVRYLIRINAANSTTIRIPDYNLWSRNTPAATLWTRVNVPAAELACSVGAFDIMELLLESYPGEKPNYTNCLHYLIASYSYYPSYQSLEGAAIFNLGRKSSDLRSGDNTAIAAQKIIALGGDPSVLPDHGITMYEGVLESSSNDLLSTLLKHGLDPNTEYRCHSGFSEKGVCTFLSDISFYDNEQAAIAQAELLVEYGAKVNTLIQRPVPASHNLDFHHTIPFRTRHNSHGTLEFRVESMTALHMARFFDRDNLAVALIELGATPTLSNEKNKIAESYAGGYARIEAEASQYAATANPHQDSGGSGLGTLINIMGAVGAGAW